ncbi:WecB/TagA/CpsF family glycosyltransferase [Saccharicrinis sp. FJH54]|uniref:WecB/TagA/CpsF family glycosyltransferase n=1 Tax=Saccharicrinis sp. FJH54 TaxID=3344665 RepID=UPI0035D50F78
MTLKSLDLLGYPVFIEKVDQIPFNEKITINTLNAHSYRIAKKDLLFSKALKSSDILLPDGISIAHGINIFYKKVKIRKIAGYDAFLYLLNVLNGNHENCFFLGSTETTLNLLKEKVASNYPNIKIATFSPPYKAEFSREDNDLMINSINKVNPKVLFIGMTAPKQEKWGYIHRDELSAQIVCSIGAVFDFYAGTVKRPNKIIIKLNLEWLGRLVKEPRRMWRRYLLSTPIYFVDLYLSVLRGILRPKR